jgi:chemotaxis signal transduction protein
MIQPYFMFRSSGEEQYAIQASCVRYIGQLENDRLHPVPAPGSDTLMGLYNHDRTDVLVLKSLPALLKQDPVELPVYIALNDCGIALAVKEIVGMENVDVNSMEDALLADTMIEQMFIHDGNIIQLLDVEALKKE